MIAVVQRVKAASVTVAGEMIGKIGVGLCVLASLEADDTAADLRWIAKKLVGLRVFPEADKDYHLDVQQVGGGLLLVSNFTVSANTTNGRRPGFDRAMKPDLARPMFDQFVETVRATGVAVAAGKFGADMLISIENDGPLTLIVQSPKRQAQQ